MLLNVSLITASCNEPDIFSWETFTALSEHICMAYMEAIEDTICIDSEFFLLHRLLFFCQVVMCDDINYLELQPYDIRIKYSHI